MDTGACPVGWRDNLVINHRRNFESVVDGISTPRFWATFPADVLVFLLEHPVGREVAARTDVAVFDTEPQVTAHGLLTRYFDPAIEIFRRRSSLSAMSTFREYWHRRSSYGTENLRGRFCRRRWSCRDVQSRAHGVWSSTLALAAPGIFADDGSSRGRIARDARKPERRAPGGRCLACPVTALS